uniref:Glutamyl-tRNA reductase n=1 Tax=Candidatus Methanomethylicus mesodigestus TaxID=1867258 RepID=A0A7C3F5L8_9CREN
MPQIICLSISHKKAPVRVLESFALSDIRLFLQRLKAIGADECAAIQTCHRVDIYSVGSHIGHNELKKYLASSTGSSYPIDLYEEFYEGEGAVRHLFYLASGLESVILGENEVLHQVEESFKLANDAGCVGKVLEFIFKGAINAGRMVRRKTSISRGSVSLGNVVMKAIIFELGTLNGKKLVIIGAGKIGCLIAKSLPRKGPITVFIANRTYSRAEKLAASVGGTAVRFESLRGTIADADAVVCATSSPHLVLRQEDLEELDSRKRLLIIDVSNPRGVDERIKDSACAKLIDLDELIRIARANVKIREEAVMKAKELIAPSLALMMMRLQTGGQKKKFDEVMRWAEDRRKNAFELALKKGKFSEEQTKVINDFSYALMRDLIVPLLCEGVFKEGSSDGC